MTQEEVADKSEVHVTSISKIERGHVNPSHETLKKLCKGLDVPHAYVVTLEDIFMRKEDR